MSSLAVPTRCVCMWFYSLVLHLTYLIRSRLSDRLGLPVPAPRHSQCGQTAMHIAAFYGKTRIVSYLDRAHPDLYKVKMKVRRPPHSVTALIVIVLVTHIVQQY